MQIYAVTFPFLSLFLSAPEYCTSAPCLNGGTCKETVTGYSCHCKSRFRGDNCEGIQRCEKKDHGVFLLKQCHQFHNNDNAQLWITVNKLSR